MLKILIATLAVSVGSNISQYNVHVCYIFIELPLILCFVLEMLIHYDVFGISDSNSDMTCIMFGS